MTVTASFGKTLQHMIEHYDNSVCVRILTLRIVLLGNKNVHVERTRLVAALKNGGKVCEQRATNDVSG